MSVMNDAFVIFMFLIVVLIFFFIGLGIGLNGVTDLKEQYCASVDAEYVYLDGDYCRAGNELFAIEWME